MGDTVIATIILLLIAFGGGFYIRDRRAKADADDAAEVAQRIAAEADEIKRRAVAETGRLIAEKDLEIAKLRDAAAKCAATARRDAEIRRAKAVQFQRDAEENNLADPDNQIRFINQAELYAEPPVNKQASRVMYALENWIDTNQPAWRMSFEVGMGAFIKTNRRQDNPLKDLAFKSYNSKRVDFLLIDRAGQPMLAVEYNGTGHDLSADASDRMNVKRLALERARIPLVEIPAGADKPDILRRVTQCLAANT